MTWLSSEFEAPARLELPTGHHLRQIYDAESGWWVVDAHAGGPLESALDSQVPRWLAEDWGFGNVHHIG